MVSSIIWIAIGGLMFLQFRKTRKAEKRKASLLWGIGSAFFGFIGAANLIVSLLGMAS